MSYLTRQTYVTIRKHA